MCEAEGIRNALAQYCQSVDSGRFDELADLFSEHATWRSGDRVIEGRDAIVGMYSSFPRGDIEERHLTVNSVIEIDGDTATATSDYVQLQNRPTGGVISRGGRYHDRFAKVDGRWQITERAIASTTWTP